MSLPPGGTKDAVITGGLGSTSLVAVGLGDAATVTHPAQSLHFVATEDLGTSRPVGEGLALDTPWAGPPAGVDSPTLNWWRGMGGSPGAAGAQGGGTRARYTLIPGCPY